MDDIAELDSAQRCPSGIHDGHLLRAIGPISICTMSNSFS